MRKNYFRLRLLTCFTASFLGSNWAIAGNSAKCDALFQSIATSKKFQSTESKINELKENRKECEGTGIYESRLAYYLKESYKFDEAEQALKAGLVSKNEYHQQLRYGLVDIAVAKGDLEKAAAGAGELRSEYRDWYGGYMLSAKVALMQGKFDESIKYGIESNKRSPEAGVYLGMAIAYHQLHDDERCIGAAYSALQLDGDVARRAPGMNEAIYSLVRLTRYEEAAKLAEARIKGDPAWQSDKVLVKAINYLVSKGYLKAS